MADDHAVVCEGYRRLLELQPDMEVVGMFPSGEAAYQWLTHHDTDVLILDISMPGRGGLDTLKRLHYRLPELKVMIFTMHESRSLEEHALRLGASRYINKASSPEKLVEAVREVATGPRTPIVPVASQDVADSDSLPHELLSPREFDVFMLLARGESVDAIALSHALSKKTIANYQTMIRQKTGCKNQLEIHRYAKCHRLVAADEPLVYRDSV